MIRSRTVLVLLAQALLAVAVVGCTGEPDTRVLFIGNSHTTSNNLPEMVTELARSSGLNLEVTCMRLTDGG